jgi:hypothetical protein
MAGLKQRVTGVAVATGRGLLNAQALLNGTAGTARGVALIEDDRRRMAAQRAK